MNIGCDFDTALPHSVEKHARLARDRPGQYHRYYEDLVQAGAIAVIDEEEGSGI